MSPEDRMPDVCCVCGMFTDQRVNVRHVEFHQVANAGDSGGVVLIKILSIFLGPIGWLVTAMISNDDPEQTRTIKRKSKFKISQCQLCAATGRPEVLDSTQSPRRFAFDAHPSFKKRFIEINQVGSPAELNDFRVSH